MMTIFLLWPVGLYFLWLGALYLAQDRMVYVPDRVAGTPAGSGLGDMRVIEAQTSDGLTLHGWFRPPSDPGRPTIVFFHGNAGSMRFRGYKARPFLDAGYGFLFAEYRGYGGNPGRPGEENLYRDGRAYMDFLRSEGIAPVQTVLFGESLGTGVAVRMASEFPQAAALILETPYTSLVDIGVQAYPYLPVRLLMRNRFDSMSLISKITMPTLVLHGDADRIVPYRQGRSLFEASAASEKQFETFPGGSHIDLFERGGSDRIMRFLDKFIRMP